MVKLKLKHILIIILFVFIGSITSLVLGDYIYWRGRYPPNCFMERIEVSGMTKSEVIELLKQADVNRVVVKPITLSYENKSFIFKPSDIGLTINPARSIKQTGAVAYRHNFLREIFYRISNEPAVTVLPVALTVDKKVYLLFLKDLSQITNIAEQDARVELLSEDKYKLVPETIGKKLEVQASLKNLERALSQNLRSASIEVKTIYPRVYYKDINVNPPVSMLSKFSTYYGVHNSEGRIHNIQHAAGLINDHIILPGKIFSLLGLIGDVSADKGFRKAYVVIGDTLDPQYGGGVCQVTTTLYNAAMLAGLDIVERHNHGLYFDIYPLGRDASVYGKSKDLKIKNASPHPVMIKILASDTTVTVKIYGTPSGRQVYFTSPNVYIDGQKPLIDTPKDSMARIREVLDKYKKTPFSTTVRMIIYENGRVIKDEEIVSRYRFAAFKDTVDKTGSEE